MNVGGIIWILILVIILVFIIVGGTQIYKILGGADEEESVRVESSSSVIKPVELIA